MTDCSGMARRDTAGDGQTTGGAPPRKRAGLGFRGRLALICGPPRESVLVDGVSPRTRTPSL